MIAEKILELKHLGLSAPKIAKHLNISMYETMKHFDYERFLKSYNQKGGCRYNNKKEVRKTNAEVLESKLKRDESLCKDWIMKHYELSLCYETCVLDIYKSYEYYILNVYNIQNEVNLNPVSNGKMRKLLKDCGFESRKKTYASGNDFYFNVERKAVL